MKPLFLNDGSLKNTLLLFGKVCLALSVLFQQVDAVYGMDKTIVLEKEKGRQLSSQSDTTAIVSQNPSKQLQELFRTYQDEYTLSKERNKLTNDLAQTISEIFYSLEEEKVDTFLSTLKILYSTAKEHLDSADQETLDSLVGSLELKAKNIPSHELVPYQPKLVPNGTSSMQIVPRLNLHDEPAELTQGEILAGSNPTPVKLIEKSLVNTLSSKTKKCFQFVDMEDNVLQYNKKPTSCFDLSTLQNHLNLTAKVYNTAIDQIQGKAYRALAATLNSKQIDESVIKTLLTNYMDEFNTKREIDATGTSLQPDELKDIKYYMKLCTSVYTNFFTRDFLKKQNLPNVNKKWDDIINRYTEITKLFEELMTLEEEYQKIYLKGTTRIETGTHAKSGNIVAQKEVETINPEKLIETLTKQYSIYIQKLNVYLKSQNYPLIENDNISEIRHVKVSPLKIMVEC